MSEEDILKKIDKKLEAILVAITLKEDDRNKQTTILKNAGLNQTEILEIIGPSEATLRVRKHRGKKK